jgi:NAD(P)-dependent dehydrogenase (short-subunit alcohol dehydrogenase family)
MIITVTKRMAEKKPGDSPEEGMIDEHGNVKNAGRPEDIGNVVVFLCSNEASFIDGSVTAVAGTQMII